MRPDAALGPGSSIDASGLCVCDSMVPLEPHTFVLSASAPRCRSCVGEPRRRIKPPSPGPSELGASTFAQTRLLMPFSSHELGYTMPAVPFEADAFISY